MTTFLLLYKKSEFFVMMGLNVLICHSDEGYKKLLHKTRPIKYFGYLVVPISVHMSHISRQGFESSMKTGIGCCIWVDPDILIRCSNCHLINKICLVDHKWEREFLMLL